MTYVRNAEEFRARAYDMGPKVSAESAWDEASLETWRDVLKKYPDMKDWVAHNKTVPMEILECLAEDSDASVRYTVAMKNRLSQELFVILASDRDSSVRERIARNKKAPSFVLERLANDPHSEVRAVATSRLRELEESREKEA